MFGFSRLAGLAPWDSLCDGCSVIRILEWPETDGSRWMV